MGCSFKPGLRCQKDNAIYAYCVIREKKKLLQLICFILDINVEHKNKNGRIIYEYIKLFLLYLPIKNK